MKIHSMGRNYYSFLDKTKNNSMSSLKAFVTDLEGPSTKISPEFKKKLQLLDRIKADKQNLWENINIHYDYMMGFTSHIKERLEYIIKNVDTLTNNNSYECDKAVARGALEDISTISNFSLDSQYAECNYLTDGKLQEFTEKYIQKNYGENASFDEYSPFHSPLKELKEVNFEQSDNLEELKQSLEAALTKIDNHVNAMKEIRHDLKEFYTGQSSDDKQEDKNISANKNTIKYSLVNLFLIYAEFSKNIPKDSHFKQIIESEQESLHKDLLKTDIPNLPEYSSLLDYKV